MSYILQPWQLLLVMELLFLPTTERGRDDITEKQIRPIASVANWRGQRQSWRKLSSF